jgi:hypothetical protein
MSPLTGRPSCLVGWSGPVGPGGQSELEGVSAQLGILAVSWASSMPKAIEQTGEKGWDARVKRCSRSWRLRSSHEDGLP